MLLFLIIATITLVSILSCALSIYLVENKLQNVPSFSKGAVIASLSTLFFLGLSLLMFFVAWPPYA